MKWLKRILIIIAILLVALILISWVYVNSLKPDYNEVSALSGLQAGAKVFYDDYAIPHIYAESAEDAYLTLGYVHAKERLWQMEVVRRIGPGRLSELFGEATLSTDKFFRSIGINKDAANAAKVFQSTADPAILKVVNAYVQGINQYILNGDTPVEYTILGIEKTPFSLTDVYHVGHYMAFSFAMAHKTEPLLTYILDKLGEDYLMDLNVHVDTSTVMIRSEGIRDYQDISLSLDKIMRDMPAPALIGSNAWIVGPEKSKTGSALFSNDPHIGFGQPAVWFEAHLEAPGLSLYGNFVAGYPFPHVGHTDRHAIGLTMFENDDIDFFREKLDAQRPGKYQYKGEWLDFDVRNEIISIKGEKDYVLEVKESVHGPVMSIVTDGMDKNETISMWWTYLQFPNRLIQASYKLMNASTMEEAREGASMIHGPGLNIMYADIEGNIAWWTAAKLPKRPAHVNSKLILDGSTDLDEVKEYYSFDENPRTENPESGFVYSANNQPYKSGAIVHPGYYLPEDRARRIVNLLESKELWGVEDFKTMLLDVTSENAPEIVMSIQQNTDADQLSEASAESLKYLLDWKGSFEATSFEAVIYTKLIYHILRLGMQDELGDLFDLYNGTHVMKRSTQPLLANSNSRWWDNVSTPETETIGDIYAQALNLSVDELTGQLGPQINQWRWDEVHTLEHGHSLGVNKTLAPYFNVGPFNVSGTTEVINNLQFRLNGDGSYETLAGPSCRRIVDFSNIRNNSWSILPTGQSGNPLSPHYADQAEMYVRGEFRKKRMDKNDIQNNFLYKSTFTPEN